jgi:hypothetical protein
VVEKLIALQVCAAAAWLKKSSPMAVNPMRFIADLLGVVWAWTGHPIHPTRPCKVHYHRAYLRT